MPARSFVRSLFPRFVFVSERRHTDTRIFFHLSEASVHYLYEYLSGLQSVNLVRMIFGTFYESVNEQRIFGESLSYQQNAFGNSSALAQGETAPFLGGEQTH